MVSIQRNASFRVGPPSAERAGATEGAEQPVPTEASTEPSAEPTAATDPLGQAARGLTSSAERPSDGRPMPAQQRAHRTGSRRRALASGAGAAIRVASLHQQATFSPEPSGSPASSGEPSRARFVSQRQDAIAAELHDLQARPASGGRSGARDRAHRIRALQSEAAALRFEAEGLDAQGLEARASGALGDAAAHRATERRPFDANRVAAQVHDALDRVGRPDVSKLMQELGGRSLAQVREVERAYNDHYGAVTGKDFRQTLLRPFPADRPQGQAVRALLAGEPAIADAHAVHHFAEAGIKGKLGIDADALQDMLRQRTPGQRRALLAAHQRVYGEPLTDFLVAQHSSPKKLRETQSLLLREDGVVPPAKATAEGVPRDLGGRLDLLDRAFGAWHGTHVEHTLTALRGMTPAESSQLQAAYAERHGGRSLAQALTRRLSGRNELRAMTLLEGQLPMYQADGRAAPEAVAHRLGQARRWAAAEAESGGIANAFSKDDEILRHTVARAETAAATGDWQEAARVLTQHLPHDLEELVRTREMTARTAATVAGVGLGTAAAIGTGGLAIPAVASVATAMTAAGAGAGVAHLATDPNATGRQVFRATAVGAVNGIATGAHGPLVGKLLARGVARTPATTMVGAGTGAAEGFASTLVSGGSVQQAQRDAVLGALAGGAMSGAAAPIEQQFSRLFGPRNRAPGGDAGRAAAEGAGGPEVSAISVQGQAAAHPVSPGSQLPASVRPDAVESALGMLRDRGLVSEFSDDQVRGALREIRRRWHEQDGSLPDATHLEVLHALQQLARSP